MHVADPRRGFVHEVELLLDAGADRRAPGGVVTVALCGSWDHSGECRWPHNSHIDTTSVPAKLRTVFVAIPTEAGEVRQRIDEALSASEGWIVRSTSEGDLNRNEAELVERLLAGR